MRLLTELQFCPTSSLKPLKTLRFQGFSVISEGLKGFQKSHFQVFGPYTPE